MPTVSNVQSHVAGLAGDDGHVISGVAIGNNDLTRGLEDEWKLWTPDQLRAAAASLEATPVNPLHSSAEVGEVTKAGYDPDRGVIYEAELDDAQLAENVARGGFEVSIEAQHANGGTVEHNGREAMLATNIRFTGMAVVQHGAAPSASAEPGEQAALSPADISEALAEDAPASTEGDASDIEISDSQGEAIQTQLEDHKDAGGRDVSMATLKKVYRRGAGAWLNSNAGATQQQWALARVEAFLEDMRNDRPLNDGNDNDLAPDGYEAAEAALAEVNGTEVDLTAPERVKNAVEAGMAAKEEYDELSDCGTGVGEAIGEAIIDDGLTPDIILNGGDIADNGGPVTYLSSHAEDAPDSPPTEWDEETWTDGCGPVQDALWGHYLDWFEGKQAELEAAMEDSEAAAVGPVEFSGTMDGDFDESDLPNTLDGREGHYLNPGETEDASSFPLVGPDGNLSRERVGEAWDLRGSGDLGMPRDAAERVLKSLGREFGEPGSEANPIPADAYGEESAEAAGTDDSVSPASGQDEGRQDSAQPDDTTTMGDDTPDLEDEVNELKAELSDVREERDELAARVEEYEQKEEAYEAAAEEFATALADSGETLLDEDELVDRFDVAELAAKVDETEEATLADAEPSVQSGGSEGDEPEETATLGDDGRERIRQIDAKLSSVGSALPDERVEELRDEAAELAGTDSYEAALEEV